MSRVGKSILRGAGEALEIAKFQREIQTIPAGILMKKFEISRVTADRWKSGQNVPTHSVRKSILDRIDEMNAQRAFARLREEIKRRKSS